jgi:uncharacterized membrane protein
MLHPLHAILLAFPLAFFPAALLFDITYLNSEQMQWTNFAAWMITGALLFGGPVLLWALILFLRGRGARRHRALVYLALVAIAWGAGLINAFQHSRDAWSSVGTAGLLLSIVSTLLILAAAWIGFSSRDSREIA